MNRLCVGAQAMAARRAVGAWKRRSRGRRGRTQDRESDPKCVRPSVRCISAFSSSAPATTPLAGARGAATSNTELAVIQEIARIAERGRFDLLFVADGLVMDPGDHPSFLCRFEPTTLISVLSATTRHIGLGATVSTSFGEPYHVARTFASIDHLSQGRAAWNVVTSPPPKLR